MKGTFYDNSNLFFKLDSVLKSGFLPVLDKKASLSKFENNGIVRYCVKEGFLFYFAHSFEKGGQNESLVACYCLLKSVTNDEILQKILGRAYETFGDSGLQGFRFYSFAFKCGNTPYEKVKSVELPEEAADAIVGYYKTIKDTFLDFVNSDKIEFYNKLYHHYDDWISNVWQDRTLMQVLLAIELGSKELALEILKNGRVYPELERQIWFEVSETGDVVRYIGGSEVAESGGESGDKSYSESGSENFCKNVKNKKEIFEILHEAILSGKLSEWLD